MSGAEDERDGGGRSSSSSWWSCLWSWAENRSRPSTNHSPPKSCKKMLNKTNKVLLYPEEGWARSASSSYWTLSPCWWNKSRCKVVEVAGTRRYTTRAKLIESEKGSLYIVGSFHKTVPDPDFKLWLTSSVSQSDQNMGYCMTGSLDRGNRLSSNACSARRTSSAGHPSSSSGYQTTHFAVITKHDIARPSSSST